MEDEQLQHDLTEADAMDTEMLEPKPQGKRRGRRVGSKNSSTKRAETAARVRAFRERTILFGRSELCSYQCGVLRSGCSRCCAGSKFIRERFAK